MSGSADLEMVTMEDIFSAQKVINEDSFVTKTPLLKHMENLFPTVAEQNIDLYLKLENMQTTGSFKIRGIVCQMKHIKEKFGSAKCDKLVTMSGGNYGKAFATILKQENFSGICVLPNTSPSNRVDLIRGLGVEVVQAPVSDLQMVVDRYVSEDGYLFCHPFDDPHLIAGYGSISMEIMEELSAPDVVLVCCGGGGLVSGIAAALKLAGCSKCRIYAVEPEGSPTMYESFKSGRAVTIPTVKSVASGLSPPFAGKVTYQHCKSFVEDVLLVSDEEIIQCMEALYQRGLVVEPSGCAALAALLNGHVPDVSGKKIVAILTGRNVTLSEMSNLLLRNNKAKSDTSLRK